MGNIPTATSRDVVSCRYFEEGLERGVPMVVPWRGERKIGGSLRQRATGCMDRFMLPCERVFVVRSRRGQS